MRLIWRIKSPNAPYMDTYVLLTEESGMKLDETKYFAQDAVPYWDMPSSAYGSNMWWDVPGIRDIILHVPPGVIWVGPGL